MESKEKLKEISFQISDFITAKDSGEQFHPEYKKNKETFRKLVKSQLKTERAFKKYFRELPEKIVNNINWFGYDSLVYKASAIDTFIKVNWDEEILSIRVILTKSLIDAILAGGNYTEEEVGIPVGWSLGSEPVQDFLRKHSIKLAGELTNTTKDRVKKALMGSIANGENREEAAKKINDVINDPARAVKIAQTESVRAFSAGRLEVAKQAGATKKEWSATIEPCAICERLGMQKPIDIDALFEGGFLYPPAHPSCRCLLRIHM